MRNLSRLLGLMILLFGSRMFAQPPDSPSNSLATPSAFLYANLNSAVRQFGNSAVFDLPTRVPLAEPHLAPQALPHSSFHYVSSRTCAAGLATAKECRVHWAPLLGQSLGFLLLEHAAAFASSSGARYDLSHGPFFRDWMSSVAGSRGTRGGVSQPVTGAVAAFLYIQNDPRGRDLNFSNRRGYWTSRLQALAFSAAYTAQWEIGPLSRASLANRHAPASAFVIAPLAGAAWAVGEDVLDRELIWRLEGRTNRKTALLAMSLLNPARSAANLLRGRAPWYRDSRETRIANFSLPFHDSPAPASAVGE